MGSVGASLKHRTPHFNIFQTRHWHLVGVLMQDCKIGHLSRTYRTNPIFPTLNPGSINRYGLQGLVYCNYFTFRILSR